MPELGWAPDRAHGTPPAGVRRIAVLRGGGLGDLVFALPALAALRAAFPAAEIVLIGEAWHRELLEGRSGPVDRVAAMPPAVIAHLRSGAEDPLGQLDRFLGALADERFDVAIQLHGGGRHSNAFARRIGARLTIGLRSGDAPALDRWVPYLYYQPEILRGLEVAALIGAAPAALEPRLTVTDQDAREAWTVLPPGDRPIAVLHPGAGDPRRRWPAERFGPVGDRLADAGATVAVLGGAGDAQLVERVGNAMHHIPVLLAGQLSLSGLVGVLSGASVVVANDSGPLHLAAAVGAATVGIFWCGNLINAGPLTRTRHRPLLSWRLDCPVCGVDCTRERCPHRESFVTDVTLDEVAGHAVDLLNRSPGGLGQRKRQGAAATV